MLHELPRKVRSCANATGSLKCQMNVSHNALFFDYDHARINFTFALTSFVDHVPCSPRTLARRTSRSVSFCSLIAEASARIHATRTVFLFSLLTSYMLSLVVDRGHGKVCRHKLTENMHDGFVSRAVLLTGTGKHHVACVEPKPSHTTYWSSHNKNARDAVITAKLVNPRVEAMLSSSTAGFRIHAR